MLPSPAAAVRLWAATVSVLALALPVRAAPGISLTAPQRVALARLVRADPEARGLFADFQRTTRAAVTETPDPIAKIQTEGKLAGDPVKVRTQHSLQDMHKLEALGWVAAVDAANGAALNTDASAIKVKQFVLAWADTNQPTGDPIDETNLEPLIVAYDITRPTFTPDERGRADTWLRRVAAEELRTGRRRVTTSMNNWNSHRLKIVGLIGYALDDRDLIAQTVQGYRTQIAANLEPDGSSFDFHERDALHYHTYDLEPLLALAIAARQNGTDLYGYQAPSEASLGKSVQFLVPYCDGTKTHAEFVHSRVAFDQKRAANGEAAYRTGSLFDTHQALKTLSLAAAFDPKYAALEKRVSGRPAARFVSWQDVLNAACAAP